MKLTHDERIARHKRFLSANWEMLAAFAWEHHQQEGRGAVLVVEEDFVHAETPQYATVHLRYVSDASPVLKEIGGWPGQKEAGWVKAYDPDERVVVLIVRDNGGTSGYLIGGPTKPSVAFAQRKAESN
jgi:hypothetical protein